MELYREHRPTSLKQLVGQEQAVAALRGMLKKGIPHALLLAGPSGCGKTTTARILQRHLECSDFREINAAQSRGIDTVREIQGLVPYRSMDGKGCRIWYFDEAHKLTGDAQTGLLKLLEDAPEHAYFFLATTDPGKLIKTIHTRCVEVRFRPLTNEELSGLVLEVGGKAGLDVPEELAARIAECADGSARKALQLLEQVAGIEGEEERMDAVLKSDTRRQAFDLARALVWGKAGWPEVCAIINGFGDGEDWEGVRRLVLACATGDMLKNKNLKRAFKVVYYFRDNFFDSGKAGLVSACFEVIHGR